jgi:hypothetical protein
MSSQHVEIEHFIVRKDTIVAAYHELADSDDPAGCTEVFFETFHLPVKDPHMYLYHYIQHLLKPDRFIPPPKS